MRGALKMVGMLLAGTLLLSGCSDIVRPQQNSRGGANAGIALQQVPDGVNEILLTVSASDMETQRETISVGSSATTFEVPPGTDRTFRAEADGYTAQVTTDVPASGTTVVLEFGVAYAIGDTGPAGGIIFYDDEADGSEDIAGARYLEAAPVGTEWTNIEWGDYGTEIGGDAQLTGIGEGQAATDAIVAHMEGKSIIVSAAQVADGLSHNGYSDWFLPNQDELDLMYQNLHLNSNGGFASEGYWSSSENDASPTASQETALFQNFGDGSLGLVGPKNTGARVRAVRAF